MKQYKILLITELSNPWNNGWYYKKGFEKNGHLVIPFDPASSSGPRDAVLQILSDQKPDFILHTKDEMPPELYKEFMKVTKVVQWYPDPVIPEWLPPYVIASNIFFTMSEGLIEVFKKLNPNVFWMSQAFEPSFFEIKQLASKDIKKYSAEVTFVGNLGSKQQYLPRRQYLQRIINEGFSFKWWGPRLPRKFKTIPLIFGKLGRAYGGKFIWGEEYAKVARLTKIFLAFDSQPRIRKSMSARMYTALGCGAFYLCQHVEGIEDVFVPGQEIITFRSEQEMIDMIKYYLNHENERIKIAEAGRRRILKDHTYELRINQMMRIIENNLFKV